MLFRRKEAVKPVPERTETRSGVSSIQELILWCQANIKAAGRLARRFLSAEQFAKTPTGSDWEVANFIFCEIETLGHEAWVLFISRDDHAMCRSSVIYRDFENQWWWVLWSPGSKERIVRCGGFSSINQLLCLAKDTFEQDFDFFDYAKIGKGTIQDNWTFVEYLEMVEQWEKAPRRARKK